MDNWGSWDLEGHNLTLSFNSPFESTFIEKESREIEGIIYKTLGWKLYIKTIVEHNKNDVPDKGIEEQIELVLNVFRGSLVNRS